MKLTYILRKYYDFINATSFVLINELEKDHSRIDCYFFPNSFTFCAVEKDYKDVQ